jgi:hypothetical protein
MGLAASQARLLSLTARIHDVEYQAQMIQSAKLKLALQEDEVYRRYNEALDAQTLTFQDQKGNRIAATFDNLCGLGSLNSNIATNGSYIFRDSEDQLIVPSEIYQSYIDFAGKESSVDPYQFAMYMMLGDKDADYAGAISEYLTGDAQATSAGDSSKYESLRTQIDTMLDNLWTSTCVYKQNNTQDDEDRKNWKADIITRLLSGTDIESSDFTIHDPDTKEVIEVPNDKVKEQIKNLTNKANEFKHKVVKEHGAEIYEKLGGSAEDFDTQKFNYYLRWAKLIQNECAYVSAGGYINGVTNAADYKCNIENDAEMLNNMLMSGRITIDVTHMNYATGEVSDTATSAASDSVVSYSNKSSIDSRELKKAEAEYENAMKKISRQDKKYDMELNRLETERSALTTEYDSVKKVISDNIERSFKIFS